MMKLLLPLCLLVIWWGKTIAFHLHSVSMKHVMHLSMGGGRSPEEKQLSKRQMFLKIRDEFNEAAKEPGFFESGERPVVSV